MAFEVRAMLSNRHAHVTQEVCEKLFGKSELTVQRYLSEGGTEFAAQEKVTLVGPKGQVAGVRLLGPCRKYTQVELLKSDCFALGVNPPIRESGALSDAAPLKIVGPAGEVELEHTAILALRHIHMGKETMEEHGIADRQMVSVKVGGERGLVFNNVLVRPIPGKNSVMHVDMEEGNAANMKNGDMVEVIL